MSYVLSLDQGTTSSRAILFDHNGSIAGVAQHEFRQIYPSSGWVEHDPMDILTSQMSSAVEVLTRVGARPRDIAAIGITNQRETTIVWDRETGKPVHNAIVWQDRRTAAQCRELKEAGFEDTIRSRTGLLLDPYFSGTKVAWILDNVEGARERARQGKLAFGTVDSWLIWNLTSGKRHVTDYTNASRTMLFNIRDGRWDEEILDRLHIPASMMPEVVWSSQRIGEVTTSLGLGAAPIAGIAGDQQAALFGQLCVNPGDSKNTYGTGCFLLENIGTHFLQSRHRLITTLAAGARQQMEYALEGSIFIGGAVVQWLRDNLRLVWNSSDIETLAASVPDSGGVVFVPAFAGLGAPHWDPNASGLIIGLHRGTSAGHIARAALESIAFQVGDVFDAMQSETGNSISELRVDGGAAANDLMLQFQADLLGLPVSRPSMLETTALGAAYLAGLAVGFWGSVEDIQAHRAEQTLFTPRADRTAIETGRNRWQNAVERSKGWNNL